MREFPPDSLIARLVELRLCTTADLQRAARRVRRMTRDLPAFDSVWVDALVQSQALTTFQARWLESHPPESLLAGEYVLRDGLSADSRSPTFVARAANRRPVVLKRLALTADELPAVELRLQLLVERARNCQTPHLAAAFALVPSEGGIFIASPFVAGLDLSQLLVRRGRFPAAVVATILDQLLTALAVWHATGAVHGDLRLSKLRLSNRGQLVLVDAGVRTALTPELLVHRVESPEEADVIAPERIGTNQPATAATDLYAAGCVCWQMLTGRPPHLTADPLAKLAAHQARRIPDVRELAPDTPAELAELICQLTSPDPQQRPASAEAARRHIGRRGSLRRDGLIRFRRQFDSAVPHLSVRKTPVARRWQVMAASLLMLGLILAALTDRGLRSELLSIAERRWPEQFSTRPDATTKSDTSSRDDMPPRALPIPAPNAQGVIVLTEAGPYAARPIQQIGPLTIQAGDGVRPKIIVTEDTWTISAERVLLRGIEVEGPLNDNDLWPKSLLQVQSQQLKISDCRWTGPSSGEDEADGCSAIVWKPGDRRDPQSGQIEFERVVFQGAMHGLACPLAPRSVLLRQVWKSGWGSLLDVEHAASTQDLKLKLEHVTLRDSQALLRCAGPLIEHRSASLIEIELINSVFALESTSALVELSGPAVRPDWAEAIRISGDGSLLSPDSVLITQQDAESQLNSPLESEELQVEGLIVDEFEFAGPRSPNPHDSVVVKSRAPRRPGTPMPGIDADQLR